MKLSDIKDERLRRRIIEADAAQNNRPVAQLGEPEREQAPVQTLARRPQRKAGSNKRMAACVVTLVSFRTRKIDDDNLIGGMKALRDAISRSLNIDDGDPRIVWQYSQVQTAGECGTQVMIELL